MNEQQQGVEGMDGINNYNNDNRESHSQDVIVVETDAQTKSNDSDDSATLLSKRDNGNENIFADDDGDVFGINSNKKKFVYIFFFLTIFLPLIPFLSFLIFSISPNKKIVIFQR